MKSIMLLLKYIFLDSDIQNKQKFTLLKVKKQSTFIFEWFIAPDDEDASLALMSVRQSCNQPLKHQ